MIFPRKLLGLLPVQPCNTIANGSVAASSRLHLNVFRANFMFPALNKGAQFARAMAAIVEMDVGNPKIAFILI